MGHPKPPPTTSVDSKTDDSNEPDLCSNDRLAKVLSNLRTISKIEGDDEIAKRINVMRNMWLDGKLDLSVQLKLHELSEGMSFYVW